MADDYLTVSEVAARLKVSSETVRRMLRDGRLRGVRIGAVKLGWRVPSSQVEAILTGQRSG